MPYRVSDQFTVSQVWQRGDERSINQPTAEISGEPAIFVIEILINKPKRVLQEIVAERAISRARDHPLFLYQSSRRQNSRGGFPNQLKS